MLNLCCVDPEGGLIRYSPGFNSLISGRQDAPVPSQLAPLIHPEDRLAFLEDLARICSSHNLMDRRSVRMVTPDGRIILMEVSGEPCSGPGESPAVNLSWRERLDESHTEVEAALEVEKFQDVIKSFTNSLFDSVVLLNMEGRIIHVNASVQEMLGYRNRELVGSPVVLLTKKENESVHKATIRFAKMMRTGKMHNIPTQWIGKSGEKVPVTMSGSVIRSQSNELIGTVVVARDERENALLADLEKRNQELVSAYEELQHLDQMKDDLLNLVGHELRAPLANILGYAEFLNEWDLTPEEKHDYTRIIYQESQRLTRLVNDILDLSRMEAGRIIYHYLPGSINRVIKAAVDSVRADAEKKKIKFQIDLDDQLEPVEHDPDRIQQVATNILHNAIKFTEEGGAVSIKTEAVESGVRVSITDQGIGIDPSDADKVFNKFEQIENIKHHSIGAGLGMSIAKQIIEEGHGGSIWFESEGDGQGAVFKFMVPEKRPEP